MPEAGAAVLGAALGHATKLKRLNLSDNTYGIRGATALAESLAKMPDMEWLNLCDTGEHTNEPRHADVCCPRHGQLRVWVQVVLSLWKAAK